MRLAFCRGLSCFLPGLAGRRRSSEMPGRTSVSQWPSLCRFVGPVLRPFVSCPAVTAWKFRIIFKQGGPFLVCIGPHNYGAGPGPGPGSSHGALGVAKGNCSSFAWHSRPFPIQCPTTFASTLALLSLSQRLCHTPSCLCASCSPGLVSLSLSAPPCNSCLCSKTRQKNFSLPEDFFAILRAELVAP